MSLRTTVISDTFKKDPDTGLIKRNIVETPTKIIERHRGDGIKTSGAFLKVSALILHTLELLNKSVSKFLDKFLSVSYLHFAGMLSFFGTILTYIGNHLNQKKFHKSLQKRLDKINMLEKELGIAEKDRTTYNSIKESNSRYDANIAHTYKFFGYSSTLAAVFVAKSTLILPALATSIVIPIPLLALIFSTLGIFFLIGGTTYKDKANNSISKKTDKKLNLRWKEYQEQVAKNNNKEQAVDDKADQKAKSPETNEPKKTPQKEEQAAIIATPEKSFQAEAANDKEVKNSVSTTTPELKEDNTEQQKIETAIEKPKQQIAQKLPNKKNSSPEKKRTEQAKKIMDLIKNETQALQNEKKEQDDKAISTKLEQPKTQGNIKKYHTL